MASMAINHARRVLAAAIVGLMSAASADGQTTLPTAAAPSTADLQRQVDDLQKQLDAMKPQSTAISALATPLTGGTTVTQQAANGPDWQAVLFEKKPIIVSPGVTAGYKDGFYIKSDDGFSVQANGLFDIRYSYVEATNKTALTNTDLHSLHRGDLSGFNLFNGQVSLQGTLWHDVFFKAMGNFGTLTGQAPPQAGSFQANELYVGYKFADQVQIRGGMVIIPYTPLRSITDYGGLMFPDIANSLVPFVPGFSLGADVLGTLSKDSISYDLLVCNGSAAQDLTDSTLPGAGRDNRLGIYTREQWAILGKVSEFRDESDVVDHQQLALMIGGGFGYESQNSTAGSFPGPKTTLAIPGLSSATGDGFTRYVVDGNVFRYIADVRMKYHGFSFFGEAAYQHIVSTGPTFLAGYPEHSIGQIGYFAEAGYFVVPTKLEIAGRFGQLYTNGLRHQMEEYELGLNYYLHGQNLKLQLAETYIPRGSAITSNNGAIANTQDWITQLQLQLKF